MTTTYRIIWAHLKSTSRRDVEELLFRSLFCLIFVGLGGEHLISDKLIQHLMPTWVPFPRLVSLLCGIWLSVGGVLLLIGWKVRYAAYHLGAFLVLVTATVHLPGILSVPTSCPAECEWMWHILQRTNFVKNICLLGVCIQLLNHQVGNLSVEKLRLALKFSNNLT